VKAAGAGLHQLFADCCQWQGLVRSCNGNRKVDQAAQRSGLRKYLSSLSMTGRPSVDPERMIQTSQARRDICEMYQYLTGIAKYAANL
jgi:hypothetical protein